MRKLQTRLRNGSRCATSRSYLTSNLVKEQLLSIHNYLTIMDDVTTQFVLIMNVDVDKFVPETEAIVT